MSDRISKAKQDECLRTVLALNADNEVLMMDSVMEFMAKNTHMYNDTHKAYKEWKYLFWKHADAIASFANENESHRYNGEYEQYYNSGQPMPIFGNGFAQDYRCLTISEDPNLNLGVPQYPPPLETYDQLQEMPREPQPFYQPNWMVGYPVAPGQSGSGDGPGMTIYTMPPPPPQGYTLQMFPAFPMAPEQESQHDFELGTPGPANNMDMERNSPRTKLNLDALEFTPRQFHERSPVEQAAAIRAGIAYKQIPERGNKNHSNIPSQDARNDPSVVAEARSGSASNPGSARSGKSSRQPRNGLPVPLPTTHGNHNSPRRQSMPRNGIIHVHDTPYSSAVKNGLQVRFDTNNDQVIRYVDRQS